MKTNYYFYKTCSSIKWDCGGIGRHLRLRNVWSNPSRFKSEQSHQKYSLQSCVQLVCNHVCSIGKVVVKSSWNGRRSSFGNLVSVVSGILNKLVNTGGKLVRECLQECVQCVCNTANMKTKKIIEMRVISPTGWLRKLFTVIHRWNYSDYYCYSSLIFHKITIIHLWLVLQTSANITRTVFATKSTGGSKCSHYVH